jgi:hypothetical protein
MITRARGHGNVHGFGLPERKRFKIKASMIENVLHFGILNRTWLRIAKSHDHPNRSSNMSSGQSDEHRAGRFGHTHCISTI